MVELLSNIRAWYNLKDRSSNFVTMFYHMTHNNMWQCVAVFEIVKIV